VTDHGVKPAPNGFGIGSSTACRFGFREESIIDIHGLLHELIVASPMLR
jgi:hypothetical protein